MIDIVQVAGKVETPKGHQESIYKGDWAGPSAVAVVRVISAIKGEPRDIGSIILVPCGYDFDESPCELTKTKEYILFLESMGRNYFHPLGPFCMHRVHGGIVGMSGFDWDGDFDPKNTNRETSPVEDFIRRIKDAI